MSLSVPASVRRWVALLVSAVVLAAALPALAQGPPLHRAGLVVVHGDGRVVTRCVAFGEETLTGADLLRRSGLPVVLASYGGLGYGVCAIDGEGCGVGQDCFCQCRGATCAYWSYSHRQPDGSWAISGVGASAWLLRDGDVDGWVWGDGAVAPPVVSFEEVCGSGSDAPGPTVEVRSTATASPAPTASLPTPTVGHGPTATPVPTPSPTVPGPTPLPSPSPSPSPLSPAPPSPRHPTAEPSNYILFVFLLLLLTGGLAWAGRRRR